MPSVLRRGRDCRGQPKQGSIKGGDTITVSGTGFGPTSVFFVDGHLAIDQSVVDENTLTGFTPPGIPGNAPIHVVNLSGTFEAKDLFSYGAPPSLETIQPASAPAKGGTHIRLTGSGFSEDISVFFDDLEVDILERGKDQSWVDVLAPLGSLGRRRTCFGLLVGRGSITGRILLPRRGRPYLLNCHTYYPLSGSETGGDVLTLARADFSTKRP